MTTVDRFTGRLQGLSPRSVDFVVVAVVAWFTGLDAASNDPDYRQADWLTWLLLAVSLLALVWRRRWPVAVTVVTGAACAGWALYGHIGELLNLPVIVALYTVAVQGDRRRTLWTGLIASFTSAARQPSRPSTSKKYAHSWSATTEPAPGVRPRGSPKADSAPSPTPHATRGCSAQPRVTAASCTRACIRTRSEPR